MTIKEVKKLRAWHREQSIVWQEGYDIWGKVIADHGVSKQGKWGQWWSDRVRDFYNNKIHGKRTIGWIYAEVAILPMSMIIGSYMVTKKYFCKKFMSNKLIEKKENR